MMTNRPWANRSRWITGIAVCASAVGLAALLGAAMTPPPRRAGSRRGARPHRTGKLCRAPRRRHRRPRTLPAGAARRSSLELDPRPLSRRHRRRPKLFLRERHRRIRALSLRARRCHQGRRRGAGVRDLPPLSAAQPRAHGLCHRTAQQETGFRHRRIVQFRPRKGTLAGERRRDERTVAQARQERCAVARDRRQAMDRGRRCPAQALRACREAHGSEQAGGCVRGVHERLRAVAGSALELFLGAQLRGIQHSNELELRGHRRLAAADGRLRHRDRRHRRRPGRDQRQARRQRSHHRGRRRQDRRADRRDRLAPG